MDNYQEMYLTLMRAVERANRILVDAQQRCEEQYLSGEEPEGGMRSNAPAESGETV